MSRATQVSVEDLFKKLGGTAMTRRARADSLFRRLRETDEDAFLGTFIRAPKKTKSAPEETETQP
ncbi:MAG TPA: hypothetical protein PKM48_13445 [Parvularculaceae bacterium]|nr:hypothetical protein [Parvularculaceae bacterium]